MKFFSISIKIEDVLLAEGSKFEMFFSVPTGEENEDGEKEEVAAKIVLIPWILKKL